LVVGLEEVQRRETGGSRGPLSEGDESKKDSLDSRNRKNLKNGTGDVRKKDVPIEGKLKKGSEVTGSLAEEKANGEADAKLKMIREISEGCLGESH